MDTSPITARLLQKPYHIKGDEFERAYKDHLSDFRTWKHREHAQKWLVFPKNIGPNLSIDETALSNGDIEYCDTIEEVAEKLSEYMGRPIKPTKEAVFAAAEEWDEDEERFDDFINIKEFEVVSLDEV